MIKEWAPEGVTVEKKDCLSHHEVMARAEVYDGERGVKLVGHRVCRFEETVQRLRTDDVRVSSSENGASLLNQALINYGLHFLTSKGYDPIQPPFFMKAEYMAKTCTARAI